MTAVVADGFFSLALRGDGTVVAWGANSKGQTDVPGGLAGVTAIAAGWDVCLALKGDGTVVSWGDRQDGAIPEPLTGVTAIADGYSKYGLALRGGSPVVRATKGTFDVPVPDGLTSVTSTATFGDHAVARRADGTVVAWGAFGSSLPGDLPEDAFAAYVREVEALTDIVAVSAGAEHCLASRSDGTVVGCGPNRYGECDVPADLRNVKAIASGAVHCLALKSDGSVAVWGDRGGFYTNASIPPDLGNLSAIDAGSEHCLALRSDGTVVAWGTNAAGVTDVPSGLDDVVAISTGGTHSLALKSDGTVVAWGWRESPNWVDVPDGLDDVTAISGGHHLSYALRSDGTLVSWGDNGLREQSRPGLDDVTAVTAGTQYVLALSHTVPG